MIQECLNCSIRYEPASDVDSLDQMYYFCSKECMDEDTARLVEGNGIVAAAELYAKEHEQAAFNTINQIRLQTTGPIGQAIGNATKGLSIAKFESKHNSADSAEPGDL